MKPKTNNRSNANTKNRAHIPLRFGVLRSGTGQHQFIFHVDYSLGVSVHLYSTCFKKCKVKQGRDSSGIVRVNVANCKLYL